MWGAGDPRCCQLARREVFSTLSRSRNILLEPLGERGKCTCRQTARVKQEKRGLPALPIQGGNGGFSSVEDMDFGLKRFPIPLQVHTPTDRSCDLRSSFFDSCAHALPSLTWEEERMLLTKAMTHSLSVFLVSLEVGCSSMKREVDSRSVMRPSA